MSYKVNVVIERHDHGQYAYSPELEGCQTQGESYEEVLSDPRETVELYMETLSEQDRSRYLSREIPTMPLEVNLA